ncbi:hypothetical protein ACTWQL_03490 [Pseudalkalibacillus sp. R45]|uniref:hypothetical protein n=1 Tax=Pseudalkalibacillus sp. R45 TaxID=3457433 RepID=UPI003FCCC454
MRFATIPSKNGPTLCPEPLLDHDTSLLPISKIDELPHPPLQPDYHFHRELQDFLNGRHLLLDEIPFPLEKIQHHYLHGFIRYEKGITNDKHGFSVKGAATRIKRCSLLLPVTAVKRIAFIVETAS